MKTPITVAYGDGIGPEIMNASLHVLMSAGAQIEPETIEVGHQVYLRGHSAGIEPSSWDSLRRTKVFYKAPISTPQGLSGGSFKSLNVTIRKTLGLYANVRPCRAYAPFVRTHFPKMDIVIIRENEEDLYAGIEHRQADEVYQCLKLISRPGCEKIVRAAFEYARANGRKKVSCFTKDNIMKMTDGLFHKVFDEIGEEYPDIEKEHWIVDIGMARVATQPERFDVIVTPNLYGDILSDITAELTGSVGLGGSANLGEHVAMFEAIHGTAPDIAGQDKANPSGLLMAGVMMLVHIGQPEVAAKVHNAWLRTIEDGIHTPDLYREGVSTQLVGTCDFAEAVIARLGLLPQTFTPVEYGPVTTPQLHATPYTPRPLSQRALVGIDVFVDYEPRQAVLLGEQLQKAAAGTPFTLQMITNRGVKVWPNGFPETFCTDHWRCRFMFDEGVQGSAQAALGLLQQVVNSGFEVIKTENLYTFDGVPGFSMGQGQ
jgi:isocitrate dehydrogenase